MTRKQIQQQHKKLLEEKAVVERKIKKLQSKCKHPNKARISNPYTAVVDISDARVLVARYKCNDCGETTEDRI